MGMGKKKLNYLILNDSRWKKEVLYIYKAIQVIILQQQKKKRKEKQRFIKSKTTIQQKSISTPTKYTFPKRRFKSFSNSPYKNKFHLISNLKRNVVFDVFPVCPWQDNLGHLCAMSTENLGNIRLGVQMSYRKNKPSL